MKLNNSFAHKKQYFSQHGTLKNPNGYSQCIDLEIEEGFRNRQSSKVKPSFNTVDVHSPKMNNYINVNQTLPIQSKKSDFQSIQVKGDTSCIFDDYERALSYNIINSHKTIQQIEKECEHRVSYERQRYKDKEYHNRQKIKHLAKKLDEEQDKRLQELTNCTDLKKKNLELRKKLSELIYDNNQLQNLVQQQSVQIMSQEKSLEGAQASINQYQMQIIALQQKLDKKLAKKNQFIEELEDRYNFEIRRLQQEVQMLVQQNKEMDFELFQFKKNQVNLQDQPNYEDRVKQLINDLENQAKKHLGEINSIHEHYRAFVIKSKELEDQILTYKKESDQALENERKYRKENVRLKMQLEQFLKKRKSEKKKSKSPKRQAKPQNDQDKENDLILNTESDYTKSKQKSGKASKKRTQSNEQEDQVLSNLVENIQSNSALVNGYIRRQFSLQNILTQNNKLLPKSKMMDQLAEYDNLIRAMGALFYTSKRMQDVVPCVFQVWKEMAFENRAKKIRTLLSESEANIQAQINQLRDESKVNINELGHNGRTIQLDSKRDSNLNEDEDEYDFQSNDQEEFMKVQDSQQSYTILPMNNLKQTIPRSQYDEDEDISLPDEEDDDEEEQQRIEQENKNKQQQWEFKEDDPEVLNAKLLEKYAQMSGAGANFQGHEGSDMIFVDENGQELDPNTVMMMMGQEGFQHAEDQVYYEEYEDENEDEEMVLKDIITADDYIDDEEEEKADIIRQYKQQQRPQDKILHQPSTSNDGSAQKKGRKNPPQQLNYYEEVDEKGNLYLYEKKR